MASASASGPGCAADAVLVSWWGGTWGSAGGCGEVTPAVAARLCNCGYQSLGFAALQSGSPARGLACRSPTRGQPGAAGPGAGTAGHGR